MKSDHQTANEDIAKLESLWKAALEDSKKFQNESQSWKDKYYNLIEQIALAKQKRFSSSSEANPKQLDLFNEAEAAEEVVSESEEIPEAEQTITVAEHTRKQKPKRVALPEDLPREVIVHDITDAQKQCACGCMKEKFSEEISEQLSVVPATIKVIQHVRPQYACPACKNGVEIAPMPKLLLPKSIASSSLVAYTITSKYVDHLPLYRQESIWQRYGVTIPRNTSCDWLMKTAELCMPLLNLLKKEIQQSSYIQADETTVQVLNEPNRSDQQKSYAWVYVGNSPHHKTIYYEYQETRAGKHAQAFLKDFRGYLQTDGYAGYNFANDSSDIIHLGCMAHARRPFVDLVKLAKTTGKSHQIVSLIQKLYAVEKSAREKKLSHEERYALRLTESKPILDHIKTWLDKTMPSAPPQSTLSKGILYMQTRWDELTAFLKHGMLEIDNNTAENAIRPFALGRKNWMFAATPRGAKASMLFYSLIMTCKANHIEPFAYFDAMLKRLPLCTLEEDYEALLPYNITELSSDL
jgi:transposase